MRFLTTRLLSRYELAEKLLKRDYAEADVRAALERLEAMGYLNDKRLAEDRALTGVNRKVGRHNVTRKLDAAGIDETVVRDVVDDAYSTVDEGRTAREILLARQKQFAGLDPVTARRRAIGLLLRRGFDEDTIRPALDEVLGTIEEGE